MSSEPTISVIFVRAALETARSAGANVDDCLRRAGVPPGLLLDPRGRLSPDQMATLLRALWISSDDEMLGLGPAKAPPGTFRLVAHALVGAADLREIGELITGFRGALPGVPAYVLREKGDTIRISLEGATGDDPAHLVPDFALVLFQRFASWLLGRSLRFDLVELPYPKPDNAREYDVIYGAPVTFGAERIAVEFPSALLDAPVIRTARDLKAYLREAPLDIFRQRDYDSSTSQKARTVLERGLLSATWPDAEEVARRLNISDGHLRRLLRAEGTSIGNIKEELLRDAAITGLARGVSADDLARQLGFSEASAFRRAFKRWTGSTPAAYQRP